MARPCPQRLTSLYEVARGDGSPIVADGGFLGHTSPMGNAEDQVLPVSAFTRKPLWADSCSRSPSDEWPRTLTFATIVRSLGRPVISD